MSSRDTVRQMLRGAVSAWAERGVLHGATRELGISYETLHKICETGEVNAILAEHLERITSIPAKQWQTLEGNVVIPLL